MWKKLAVIVGYLLPHKTTTMERKKLNLNRKGKIQQLCIGRLGRTRFSEHEVVRFARSYSSPRGCSVKMTKTKLAFKNWTTN
jgi:hypothetical protein